MYEQFFGLRTNPFVMTPDPEFLFLTPAHREALAGLNYAILQHKGFAVLTGEAGTGKTTLLRTVLESVPASKAYFSLIVNPTLSPGEFLEMVLLDFGIPDIPASKAQRLVSLDQFLLQVHRESKAAVLIVDEAHKLPPDVLEEIRLLANFETARSKLLQIVLAGQSELDDLLNRDDLRQLKQRVAVRLGIRPLSAVEVEQYMRHRWMKAGGTSLLPFGAEAIERITLWSRGIPRLVNAICDNALLLGFGEGTCSIGRQHIVEVVADLDLPPPVNGSGRTPSLVAKAVTENLPAPVPQAPIRLERHLAPAPKPSLLARWAARLGLS